MVPYTNIIMLKYLLIITINFIIYIETKNLKKSKKYIYIYIYFC